MPGAKPAGEGEGRDAVDEDAAQWRERAHLLGYCGREGEERAFSVEREGGEVRPRLSR